MIFGWESIALGLISLTQLNQTLQKHRIEAVPL